MADISIGFSTTPVQDVKLEKVLLAINAERAAANPPLPPFHSIEVYLKYICVEAVKGYVAMQKSREDAERQSAYDAADAQKRAQIDAILGIG
jgi:hypothetical protein